MRMNENRENVENRKHPHRVNERVRENFHLNGKQSQFGSLRFQVTSLKRV